MKYRLARHVLSIAVLPFTVTVVVPLWLAWGNGIAPALADSVPYGLMQILGVIVLIVGVVLFFTSLSRFVTEGEGTLAPWDPPRRLVIRGPYRYVRNPMISGVVFILFGEALILLSTSHFIWGVAFAAMNLVYIPLVEERMLHQRFGEEYEEYSRHVPRLLPRLKPYEQR